MRIAAQGTRTDGLGFSSYAEAMTLSIAIGGAGIGGLCAALALGQGGHEVTLFERAPQLVAAGAGIVLAQNATAHLSVWGLGAELARRGAELSALEIRDAGGRALSRVSPPGQTVGIFRGVLQELLLSAALATGRVRLVLGSAVEGFEQRSGSVVVEPHRNTGHFDLLVGADGIGSAVRRALWGEEALRMAGYRCFRGIAWGDYGLTAQARESWGVGRRLGLVPISGGVYWFAVENATPGEPVPAADVGEHLRARFSGFADPARRVLEATEPASIVQHDLADRKPRKAWGRGRVTLLGDAAHPMTPNLGQGAGQAIEDVAALAQVLVGTSRADVMLALARYEQLRARRAGAFVTQSFRLGRLAQTERPWLCAVRNFALGLTPDWVGDRRLARLLLAGGPGNQGRAPRGGGPPGASRGMGDSAPARGSSRP